MKSIFCSDDLSSQCSTWSERKRKKNCHLSPTVAMPPSLPYTHMVHTEKRRHKKTLERGMRCRFSICSSVIAQRKGTKHYLKIEDTHTHTDKGENNSVSGCVYEHLSGGFGSVWLFHLTCNLTVRWKRHTHTSIDGQTDLPVLSHPRCLTGL